MSNLEKDKFLESLERRYAVSIIFNEKRNCYNIYTYFGHTIGTVDDKNKIEETIINNFGPEYFGQEEYNKLKLKLNLGEA